MVKRRPWGSDSEASLLELARREAFLWDPRDPQHRKRKVRQRAFDDIAEELRARHPELADLNGAHVRVKLMNLRRYFLSMYYNANKRARSGSEGHTLEKWSLPISVRFLIDPLMEQTPTESGCVLPPMQTSMMSSGDDGYTPERAPDPAVINYDKTLQLPSSDSHPFLMSHGSCSLLPTKSGSLPHPVPSAQPSSGPSSCPSSAARCLLLEEISQKRKASELHCRVKVEKDEHHVDDVNDDTHLATETEVIKFANSLRKMVKEAAEKMPVITKLQFMQKMLTIVQDINRAIAAGEYPTPES